MGWPWTTPPPSHPSCHILTYSSHTHLSAAPLGVMPCSSLFLFLFSLECGCFTMLCQFLAVQQSESVIRIHISPLFQTSFSLSPQSVEQSSLCSTVGSHQLPILYIVVYICQSQSPNSSPSPLGVHKFFLYICVSISALQISSSVPFFQIPHISDILQYLFFSF